jgi:hypothetical protein
MTVPKRAAHIVSPAANAPGLASALQHAPYTKVEACAASVERSGPGPFRR